MRVLVVVPRCPLPGSGNAPPKVHPEFLVGWIGPTCCRWSHPLSLWVEAVVRRKRRHLYALAVVGVLCQWKEVGPVVLLEVGVAKRVCLKDLINRFRLTVRLRMGRR